MIKNIINSFIKRLKKQSNSKAFILSQLFLVLLSFVSAVVMFYILKPSETRFLNTITEYLPAKLISVLFIFIMCEFFYLISFHLFLPLFFVYPVITFFTVINSFKMTLRSEPIVYSDLLLFRESTNIAGGYIYNFENYIQVFLLFLAFLFLICLFIKRIKMNFLKRLSAGIATLAVFSLLFFFYATTQQTFVEKHYKSSTWDLCMEYRKNGFLLGFLNSYKRSLVTAPEGYDEKNVSLILDKYDIEISRTRLMADIKTAPNVIVIMNESYWDSNNLTGVSLNQDPMASVRGLIEKTNGARLLSPQLGGGTSNVEYEFLTGKSIYFYPTNSIVYQQYITKKQWSLAWYFYNLGYSTFAIHPYAEWYWKRNTVYPLLGFEKFYSEGDMLIKERTGIYISDSSLTREIINRYIQYSENGEKPVFNFSVSMQNHGPYYRDRYRNEDIIKYLNRQGDKNDDEVQVFFEGVRFSSEAFIELTEYFKNVERPTYIIMFGDHAPGFVSRKQYYACDAENNIYPEDYFNEMNTPLIVWTNKSEQTYNIKNSISSFMLTEELFNITGLPKPNYIRFLSEIRKKTAGFTYKFMLNENGENLYPGNPENDIKIAEIEKIIKDIGIIQYDATLGKQYMMDEYN